MTGTEAMLESATRPIRTRLELFRVTWQLIVVTLILGMHADVDNQIFQPYFYSRVACCGGRAGGPPLPDSVDYGGHALDLRADHP